MRVLIMSYVFPPYNTIGAVRVGKLAKYLRTQGHEVRVVAAKEQPLQATLPLEIPEELVTATAWWNVNRPVELAMGGRQQVAESGYAVPGGAGSWRGRLLKRLGGWYKSCLNFPDGQIGWYPLAWRAASRVALEWRPDVIYASGAPFTSLVAASKVARRHGIPWVAELRDLWVDNANYDQPRWRRWLESRLERRVLSTAAGLVTVSEPLAEKLRAKYGGDGKPTETILNGFDPEDYPAGEQMPLRESGLDLVYTGMVYEGKQDPAPLFAAMRQLGAEAEEVRVTFYGRYLESVREAARKHEVEPFVTIQPSIPHRDVLRVQARADALLMLLWNDPRERGVYSGKLFEYVGARRPILATGLTDNVAGELIRKRGVGVALEHPDEIAEQLRTWLRIKREKGVLPGTDAAAGAGLSRQEQARQVADFLVRVLGGKVRADERS